MFQVYSLERQIQQRMQAQKVPGLALAVVKDEEIIYACGFGVTSVEEDSGLPVTPRTLFLIGSTAKPLTGTAIMRLVEAGKLDLDLPVHAYVDWLRFHEEGVEKLITLRMLMSHTAGPAPMSTVLDLANFAILHLNQGKFHGKQILTPESVQAMHTRYADFYTANDAGYGLTFRMEMYKGKHILWHNGLARATTSIFCLVPEERIGIMMLFNGLFASFEAPGLVYSLIDRLLELPEQMPEPQFVEPDTRLWPRYAGTYLGVRGGLAIIEHKDNQLQLDFNGDILPMRALRSDLYAGLNAQGNIRVSVGFLSEEEGPVQWITVNGFPMQRFERDTTFVPDSAKWQVYVGTYEADNDTLKVRIEDGQLLLLDVKDKHEVKCIPLDETRFACPFGLIEFMVGDDGTVSEICSAETFHYMRVE